MFFIRKDDPVLEAEDIAEISTQPEDKFVAYEQPGFHGDVLALLNIMAAKGYYLYPSLPVVEGAFDDSLRRTKHLVFLKMEDQVDAWKRALDASFAVARELYRDTVREEVEAYLSKTGINKQ